MWCSSPDDLTGLPPKCSPKSVSATQKVAHL
jgi:hypothetical protein